MAAVGGHLRVSDIMSRPVRTIGANEPATAAWEAMRLHRIRHLVVADRDGCVVGVISASDLGGRKGDLLRSRRRVADLMTENVVAAQPETTVREAANLMRGHGVNCLPVFDARDHLKGIVTVVDLLELLGRGAERPTVPATRAILKDRGVVPRQATAKSGARRASR
jgi:CBS domain-containing protein